MIRPICVALALLALGSLHAQDPAIDARVTATNGASLTIKQVLPDSFPEVRVIFRAESSAGQPIWDLHREQLTVLENGHACETTCLHPITSPVPVNIALVVDHSGSMAYDAVHTEENSWQTIFRDTLGDWHTPAGYTMPMAHAHKAVRAFVHDFDTRRDAIALIGFSTTVDVRMPLTHEVEEVDRRVERMRPTDRTALYDAVIAGVKEVRNAEGLRAVVVLTDGLDNSSRSTWKRALRLANADSVLVYTIGLGSVDRAALTRLAEGTGARAFFTSSPSSLSGIYAEIGRSIRAYYSLTYRSVHFAGADTTRDVDLLLDFNGAALRDSITAFVPDSLMAPYRTSEAVVEAVIERSPSGRDWTWPLGMAAVVAVGATGLAFRYRRTERAPKRELRVWPVPTAGELFIDLPAAAGSVRFMDARGALVKRSRLAGGTNHLDLSQLPPGRYSVAVTPAGGVPEVSTVIIVR